MTVEAQTIFAEKFEDYNISESAKGAQTSRKQNGLNEVFGIWKNENITLNSIREEAWQRTK